MKLSEEEAREIVYEDHEDWDMVHHEFTGQRRWVAENYSIHIHKPSEKHYAFNYDTPLTESQDSEPFEYGGEVTPVEVHQVEKQF